MLKQEHLAAAVKEVGTPPKEFCSLWPTIKKVVGAIVAQVSNPFVKLAWTVLKGLGNALYKTCPH